MKLTLIALILSPLAAVAIERPLHWTADIARVTPMQFDAMHGDALTFNVDFNASGNPVDLTGLDATLYWQTNGMESAWWSATGTVSNSTARALFPTAADPGSKTLNFFLGLTDGSNVVYGAAARVTFRNSPGATPNTIAPPVVTLDFATIDVLHAPWATPDDLATKADSDDLLDYVPLDGDSTITGDITINGEVSIIGTGGLGVEGGLSVYGGSAALYGGIAIGPAGDQLIDGNLAGDKIIFEGHGEDGTNRSELQPDGSDVMTSNRVAAAISTLSDSIPTTTSNIVTKAYVEDLGISSEESDPTVPAWAKAATRPTYTAAEVGAATPAQIAEVSADNAQTRQIVTTWENFLDGSNVVFSITNYLSGTYSLDAAKLRILELREGTYQEVFNSRDEILLHIENFRTNDFRVATNQVIGAVNAAIGNKADRDWGKYTSAGSEAPANTVYMTAPNTVFAGGLEYERVAVGEGAVCVLTTRGAPVWTQGDEGTFKFQDDGGTNYFGFAKTDSYTIGANTDGITVQGGVVTLTYNITMSGRPCVWYKSSLSSGAWEQLNLPDGSPVAGASHAVTWEANPPANSQVCYINVGNQPQGFFRATVEVAGEAKFMTNMKADLSGGIICPNTATGVNGVIKPSFNGSSVIWTWSAN